MHTTLQTARSRQDFEKSDVILGWQRLIERTYFKLRCSTVIISPFNSTIEGLEADRAQWLVLVWIFLWPNLVPRYASGKVLILRTLPLSVEVSSTNWVRLIHVLHYFLLHKPLWHSSQGLLNLGFLPQNLGAVQERSIMEILIINRFLCNKLLSPWRNFIFVVMQHLVAAARQWWVPVSCPSHPQDGGGWEGQAAAGCLRLFA